MSIRGILRNIYIRLKRIKSLIKYFFFKEKVDFSQFDAETCLKKNRPKPLSTAIVKNNICNIKQDLTIIIPVYNSEKWILECIESIISQETEYSFLAIFVDDGSTDRTAEILDRYLNSSFIKVIHQENKGYSGARNVALKEINSKYIMFVDSDDFLLPDAIQKLLSKAFLEDADIVEGNGYRFNENGRLGIIKKTNTIENYWGGPWMKVMKSSLWENLAFPEGYLYEDTIIGSLIYPLANKIYFIPDEVYAYRIHKDSITQKHDKNVQRVDSYWIMILMFELQKELNIPIDYDNYKRVMKHIVFTFRRIVLLPDEVKKSIFICTSAFVCDNFEKYIHKKDQYYLLAKSLINKDYAKYTVYCEELF